MSVFFCEMCQRPHDGDEVEMVVAETAFDTFECCAEQAPDDSATPREIEAVKREFFHPMGNRTMTGLAEAVVVLRAHRAELRAEVDRLKRAIKRKAA